MPYIGNPSAQRFTSPRAASVYSGDGSTVAFTLEEAVTTDEDILVSVDGVIQEPSVAYAVSSGTTLTFTAAPSSNSGNNIFVYYIARTLGSVSMPDGQNVNAANFSASGTGAITGDLTVDTSTLKVDSTNNRVGVGTTSPDYVFEIETAENAIANFKSTDANANIRFTDSNSTANGYAGIGAIGDDLTLIAGNDNRMKIDSAGHVTMPNQSAFNVTKSGDQSNIAVGSVIAVTFDTEYFDQNADFGSNVFTAPVDGKYQFNVLLALGDVDIDASFIEIKLVTSNRTYTTASLTPKSFDLDADYHALTGAYLVDMDANDTSSVAVFIYQGAAQTDIRATQSLFSGYLVA